MTAASLSEGKRALLLEVGRGSPEGRGLSQTSSERPGRLRKPQPPRPLQVGS